ELLLFREVVFRHFAQLLLEPAFEFLARGPALARWNRCETILFRLERRLALAEVQLPPLPFPLVGLQLPQAGFELLAKLFIHRSLLARVGLEGLAGLRLLIDTLLHLRGGSGRERIGAV